MNSFPHKPEHSEPSPRPFENLYYTKEGRLLLAGLGLSVLMIGWMGVLALWNPEKSQDITGMVAIHILFGRAAGMSFGYSEELGHALVIPVNLMLETILVFIFYPLFVFSWRKLVVFDFLSGFMSRMEKAADKNKDFIRRYGILGLFLFVWFPFWMTGPLVGSIIGFLLNMRLWVTMSVVLGGTSVAIVGWAIMLREFHDRIAAYSPYAPLVLVLFLVLIVIVGQFLARGGRRDI